MTETELVTAAKSGDVDAFCELYEIHKIKLFNHAYYKLGNVLVCLLRVKRTVGLRRQFLFILSVVILCDIIKL